MPPLLRAVPEQIRAVSLAGIAGVVRHQLLLIRVHVLRVRGRRRHKGHGLQELEKEREGHASTKTVLAGAQGFAKSRGTRLGKLRRSLPAFVCVAALIGASISVVGGLPSDCSGSNQAAAVEAEVCTRHIQAAIEAEAEHVLADRFLLKLLQEDRPSRAEKARTPITAGDVTGRQSAASWASTTVYFFFVSAALWAMGSRQGRVATADLVALLARVCTTNGTRLKRRVEELERRCQRDSSEAAAAAASAEETVARVRSELAVTRGRLDQESRQRQTEVSKARKSLSAGAAASEGFRRERDEAQTRNETLVAELAKSQGLAAKAEADLRSVQAELATAKRTGDGSQRRVEELERRCQRDCSAAAAAAASAEETVARVRSELAVTRGRLDQESRQRQAEAAKARERLSAAAVASVGFRRERDEAQTRSGALVAELAESQALFAKARTDLRSVQAELEAAKRKAHGSQDGQGGTTSKSDPAECGLVNRRNQCSLNASMQFFRHWPLFFECAIAANAKWEAAVAQLRTSAPKLPPKGLAMEEQEEIPDTLASVIGAVFQALERKQEGTGFSSTFAKKYLSGVNGLTHGGQADAAEVMDAILDALSEVDTLQPAMAAVVGKTRRHLECERGRTRQLGSESFKLLTLHMEPLGKGGRAGTGGGGGGGGGRGRGRGGGGGGTGGGSRGREGGGGRGGRGREGGGGRGRGRGNSFGEGRGGGGGNGSGGGGGGTSAPSVLGLLRKMFKSKEPLGLCTDCSNLNGEKVDPHKRTCREVIDELPARLFLRLGRAFSDGNEPFKLTYKVDIPLELDMGEFTAKEDQQMYDLQGVLHHQNSGKTTAHGHYFTCVRTEGDTWRRYSDQDVRTVGIGSVVTKDAAILSYARRV